MKISLSTESVTHISTEILVLGILEKGVGKDDDVVKLDKAMSGALMQHVKDEGFTGKEGETLKVPARGRVKASWIVLVGLGSRVSHADGIRLASVIGTRSVRRQKTIAVRVPEATEALVRAGAEGLTTGPYRYDRFFTGNRKPKGGLKKAFLLVPSLAERFPNAVEEGTIVGEAINVARDLVNGPPNVINPPALADFAAEACSQYGVTCDVWGKAQIEAAGMPLFLAVNAGSGVEPRLIHMSWTPKNSKKRVVFVGKGLTFDSGGLCLKPAKAMAHMKCDMGGAATTIGAVLAAARLKLPIEVHGVIGSTENMTGGFAYRPGDVYSSYDGKTVEIANTDAEGRLVLADVLAWARELEPDFMIDHATLTGACMVALGPWTAGLYANDPELLEMYYASSTQSGESLWKMPLDDSLKKTLASDIADLKHISSLPYGGSITAALFLSEFIGKTRWAHLDIAGPSFTEKEHEYLPQGGTGFGVSTAVAFLEQIS
ncbi:MAG: leucyl aminopeptidase [Myxococcota bacterium]